MADILKLVQTTQRERVPVAQFLREWADAVEAEGEVTTAAIIILHDDKGSQFLVRTRRCNLDLVQTLGIMALATADLAKTD